MTKKVMDAYKTVTSYYIMVQVFKEDSYTIVNILAHTYFT